MCKFLYTVFVTGAYLLGLFCFLVLDVSQEVWVIVVIVSVLLCFYWYKIKKNV